jgi:hypothetical protein
VVFCEKCPLVLSKVNTNKSALVSSAQSTPSRHVGVLALSPTPNAANISIRVYLAWIETGTSESESTEAAR